jgi:hypothetical protein
MKPSQERNFHLLKYQSNASATFGVEVVLDDDEELDSLLSSLKWLGQAAEFACSPDFIVCDFAGSHATQELRRIAECARASGLIDKLCLVCPLAGKAVAEVIDKIQHFGMRALVGGVGPDARFADLTDYPIDGLVLDRAFISKAHGEPQAASVLEAIATLSLNLGLKTFASRCVGQTELDVAASCGVDYLTFAGQPPLEVHLPPPFKSSSQRLDRKRVAHG